MSPQKTLSKFSYKALDADGRKVTGVEAAETQTLVTATTA